LLASVTNGLWPCIRSLSW